jgi:hypothetical protein
VKVSLGKKRPNVSFKTGELGHRASLRNEPVLVMSYRISGDLNAIFGFNRAHVGVLLDGCGTMQVTQRLLFIRGNIPYRSKLREA